MVDELVETFSPFASLTQQHVKEMRIFHFLSKNQDFLNLQSLSDTNVFKMIFKIDCTSTLEIILINIFLFNNWCSIMYFKSMWEPDIKTCYYFPLFFLLPLFKKVCSYNFLKFVSALFSIQRVFDNVSV